MESGCIHLHGQPLLSKTRPSPRGARKTWYSEDQINEINKSFLKQTGGHYETPSDPCVSTGAIKKTRGFGWHQLEAWEDRCPYHATGRLVPVWVDNKLPGRRRIKTYRIRDLDEIQSWRNRWHAGVYELPEGRRLNLAVAADRLDCSRQFLKNCIRKCPRLPEGKLASVKLRPPRPRARGEHTILETDLERLRAAIQAIDCNGTAERSWKDADEIAAHYGRTDLTGQIAWAQWLRMASDAGTLSSTRLAKRQGMRVYWTSFYDLDEINRKMTTQEPDEDEGHDGTSRGRLWQRCHQGDRRSLLQGAGRSPGRGVPCGGPAGIGGVDLPDISADRSTAKNSSGTVVG